MVVKEKKRSKQSGQALIEFMLLIPILMTFLWYMMHVSVAINKSIVAQKHVRSHVFLRIMNHPRGPQHEPDMTSQDRSAYFIGVANEVLPSTGTFDTQTAPVVKLGIGFKPKDKPGAVDDDGEPEPDTLRQRVRVRTAFGICTVQKKLKDGRGFTDYCAEENNGQ